MIPGARILLFLCAFGFALTGRGVGEHLFPQAVEPVIQPDIPSVCQSLAAYFPVGAAVWAGDITGPHSELLKKHFNSITAENDIKWEYVEPEEGNFTFGAADALAAFAKANHILVRGHNLAWHRQNPKWLFEDAASKEMQPTPENKALLLGRLRNHVRAVVFHFGDDVYAWDVVNEVIDPGQPDGFRRSPWFRITARTTLARRFAPRTKLPRTPSSTSTSRARRIPASASFSYSL
jgi:endo-1,4-beta-xylanase